jgi:hypothetical protein
MIKGLYTKILTGPARIVIKRPLIHYFISLGYILAPIVNVVLLIFIARIPLSDILQRLFQGYGYLAGIWLLTDIEENRDATMISFISESEFFRGKTETFPVMRFFGTHTAYPAEKLPVYPALRPVCLPHQGKMAGQALRGAARSSGV